jgi:heat-inducible transcriptional repressor
MNADFHTLNSREQSILQAIVHNFILHATPVGSRHLSKYLQHELNLSPATIRNAMADLEEMGFITQPHTSAGRVPTDKGYRYYVDSLVSADMSHDALSLQEIETLHDTLGAALTSENVSRDVSKVIGSLSHYLSIVRIPQVHRSVVERIELYRLINQKLLVALTLHSEVVRTITLEAHVDLEHEHLDEIQRVLNERIAGKTLNYIRDNLAAALQDVQVDNHALLRLFVEKADELFAQEGTMSQSAVQSVGTVHIAGAQHLFDYPEFGTAERIRTIIELIESEEVIVHLLDNAAPEEGKVRVLIGQEMDSSLMGEYSLLTTKYRHAGTDSAGTIGLIGPKRMNYSRMIAIVHHVATVLAAQE